MMKKRNFYVLLAMIVLMAAFLRLCRLGGVPPSPNRDEASIGYNAYSILKTGRDEYNRRLPISIKSFGDYKLPLYLYLTIPSVAIFGLNVISVRLVSALAGIAAVALTGLLANELLEDRLAALGAALILALNPWHLFFSHAAFETNLSLTLIITAVWFFRQAQQKPRRLLLAYFFLGLTLLTYHAADVFTPLFGLGLSVLWLRKNLPRSWLAVSLALFTLIGLAAFFFTGLEGGRSKFAFQSIANDPAIRYFRIDARRAEHPSQDRDAKIFHNRYLLLPYQTGLHYLRHFSPEFLFETGGKTPGQNLVEFGNLLLIEAVFLALGLYFLLRHGHPALPLIGLWLFLAPLPGAITRDAPHSARTLPLVFPLVLIGGYGLGQLLAWGRKTKVGKGVLALFALALAVNAAMFLESYFYHFPLNRARFWGYDYAELARSKSVYKQAGKVVLNGKNDFPYIFFLFYNQADPKTFQRTVVRDEAEWTGLVPVKRFDKFEFVEAIDYDQLWRHPDTLFVDRRESMNRTPEGTIDLPNGKPVLGWIYVPPDPCVKPHLIPPDRLPSLCPFSTPGVELY
jgi:4-amino-4-deoxy-L-arabinose transferase-like glycosyltransferase